MRVQVTARHISGGCRQSAKFCPVAVAISEAIGKQFNVAGPYCRPSTGLELLPLPKDVTNRIQTYDLHGEMEPFEFELEYEPCKLP
jgi:hypothetical protein